MTVVSTINKIREEGDGLDTTFDFAFPAKQTSDIKVSKIVRATGVTTLLTEGADYTVSLNTTTEGGTVTYIVAPLSTEDSFIKRELAFTQGVNIPTESNFPESSVNSEFDRSRMLDIQIQEQLNRSLIFTEISALTDITVPDPVALKFLFSLDGLTLEWRTGTDFTDLSAYPGSISSGLESALPASPNLSDIYIATDTKVMYVAWVAGTYTKELSINQQSAKATPVDADLIVIEDSADSNAKKKVTLTNLVANYLLAELLPSLAAADSISRGFEIADAVNDDLTITVQPGTLFHGNTRINKTANITLTLATPGDWWDGATDTFGGGAGFCYVGVNASGDVKLLGNNPPDKADTAGNTDGQKRYWFDSSVYWRVIGAVPINTDDKVHLMGYRQRGNWAFLDSAFEELTGGQQTGTYTDIDCQSSIPAFSKLGKFNFTEGAGGGRTLSYRANGSADTANTIGLSVASIQVVTALDASQVFEYIWSGATASLTVDTVAYGIGSLRQ